MTPAAHAGIIFMTHYDLPFQLLHLMQDGNVSAPVLLWLQGGPGASSLLGLFLENGPFLVDKDGNLQERPWTWNSKYHMIYIDNPVSYIRTQ